MCLAVCVCAVHALSLINHACICWRSSLISRSTTSHTLTRQSWLPRVSYNPPHVGILLVHVKTTSFLAYLPPAGCYRSPACMHAQLNHQHQPSLLLTAGEVYYYTAAGCYSTCPPASSPMLAGLLVTPGWK
jgi:hypothetical protein